MDIFHLKEQVRKAIRAYKRKKAERLSTPPLRRLSSEQRRAWMNIVKNMVNAILEEDSLKKKRMLRYYLFTSLPPRPSVIDSCLCAGGKKTKNIGSGAFGKAYLLDSAVAPADQRTCPAAKGARRYIFAVKVENIDRQEREMPWHREKASERFMKSISIGKLAGDIGVGPRVYDGYICHHKGQYYGITIMDYIDGQTLARLRSNKQTTPDDLKKVESALKRQVKKMSDHGIIHHDLHSNNVLVYKDKAGRNRVKIIDYGHANMINDENIDMINNDYTMKQKQKKEQLRMAQYALSYLVTKGIVAAAATDKEDAADTDSESEGDDDDSDASSSS